ncbi:Nucleoside-diphosphate-sugar epimerase [Paracoccus isoporae]|uniref:Nucleoside-diphosphate-sugar epimerase n=1 Tax=Paracoccus isoporae TaxID=591205 RepID=A0A1G6YN32_9RHOB|nr:SDR family oxidoreductase [Paracoccus isoporae]SDD91077.1 Nucleoside-diphosphate-sugar epimerase [Paracoccus isoporae]
MHMLILGHGYTAAALTPRLIAAGWTVTGTTRSDPARVAESGAEPLIWPGDAARMREEIARADAILSCVAPVTTGTAQPGDATDPAGTPGPVATDPVLAELSDALRISSARWVGYLSSTNVYGDHGGAWVDETTPPAPTSHRGRARVAAEQGWADLAAQSGWALTIFRLAGIYGPGRGPFAKLRQGRARMIEKPGQVFSRIHVDDIAGAVIAALNWHVPPRPDAAPARPDAAHSAGLSRAASREAPAETPLIVNLCDDAPCPPQEVIAAAAAMLHMQPPPREDFATARMTEMARSFYRDSKRVRNDRLTQILGYRLRHPDYRSGLAAILAAERG